MNSRAVVGFLVAPLFSAAMLTLLTPISRGVLNTDLNSILALMPIVYLFAFATTVILGVPAFLVLNRVHLVRWWSAMAAGLVVGLLASVLIQLPAAIFWPTVFAYSAIGGVSGLIFWLIWKPRHAA